MLRLPQKGQKGFTLVEVLVVVIIIAVLAAIAVPIYLNYVRSARAAEAQEAIGSILAAGKVFQSRNGFLPGQPMQMQGRELNLDPLTLARWTFNWTTTGAGANQRVATITFTSLAAFPEGAGKRIVYNAGTGQYTPDSYGQ